jgi:hypothetical protein
MLAHCLAQSGQFRQADALLTNLLKEHEDTYPKGSLDRAVLLMVRASSLTERDKELPTAAAMFTEAYEAYRSKLGANHTRAQTCASQLQKLYEKLGKAEEAVRWKNRSVEKQQ